MSARRHCGGGVQARLASAPVRRSRFARKTVAGMLATLLSPPALAALPLDDGEYRCDGASDTTAEFIYFTVDDGKLGAFELVAVNKLRADVCQLSLSHGEGEIHAQKNGWRVDMTSGDAVCHATLARDGTSLVIRTAGEGCRLFCGAQSYFWELRYDLKTRRCSIK